MAFDLSRRRILGLLALPGAATALSRLTGGARAQEPAYDDPTPGTSSVTMVTAAPIS
jgi:hypothetical protein